MAANPNNLATDLPARGRKSNMAENNARAEARRAADERYPPRPARGIAAGPQSRTTTVICGARQTGYAGGAGGATVTFEAPGGRFRGRRHYAPQAPTQSSQYLSVAAVPMQPKARILDKFTGRRCAESGSGDYDVSVQTKFYGQRAQFPDASYYQNRSHPDILFPNAKSLAKMVASGAPARADLADEWERKMVKTMCAPPMLHAQRDVFTIDRLRGDRKGGSMGTGEEMWRTNHATGALRGTQGIADGSARAFDAGVPSLSRRLVSGIPRDCVKAAVEAPGMR